MCKSKDLVISISGNPGSGKSAAKDILTNLYKSSCYRVKEISIGNIFRKMAKSMRINIADLNEKAKTDSSIDKKVDSYLKKMGENLYGWKSKFINFFVSLILGPKVTLIDSRMAWYFIPKSFKVRLIVDSETAGKRIFERGKRTHAAEDSYSTVEEAICESSRRNSLEISRYNAKYGVDLNDANNYDLIIKTDNYTAEEVAAIIKYCSICFVNSKPFEKFWVTQKLIAEVNKFKPKKLVNSRVKKISFHYHSIAK